MICDPPLTSIEFGAKSRLLMTGGVTSSWANKECTPIKRKAKKIAENKTFFISSPPLGKDFWAESAASIRTETDFMEIIPRNKKSISPDH
jgi:hypothetical protein